VSRAIGLADGVGGGRLAACGVTGRIDPKAARFSADALDQRAVYV
jgi:hypothetical protein